MQTTANYQLRGLKAVADRLTTKAKTCGQATSKLQRGLTLVLRVQGDRRILSLGRLAPAQPSAIELNICMEAFACPPETLTANRVVKGVAYTYNVIDITWIEIPVPVALPTDQLVVTTNQITHSLP